MPNTTRGDRMAAPTKRPRAPATKKPRALGDTDNGKKERDARKKAKLRSFIADPPSIEALGTSTLRWSVAGIPPDDVTINLGVFLEDEEVEPVGSKAVSPSELPNSTPTIRPIPSTSTRCRYRTLALTSGSVPRPERASFVVT